MDNFFNKMPKRSVGSSSASKYLPLIQESGKESTQPSPRKLIIDPRKGHFLNFLDWHAESNENIESALKKVPLYHKMTSPDIQKDIAHSCAKEMIGKIFEELGDGHFAILVDESHDVSCKQQMAVVLRYVDMMGFVMERLLGLVHVTDTSSLSLKENIYSLLSQYSLSPSRIRGQWYDGASNMRGHINGLRALIMQDCPSAHYIHCFAHQLELTLVSVANHHDDVEWFLGWVGVTLNVIGGSYRRRDEFREKQTEAVEEALRLGELQIRRGLNQELGLGRSGDTRWGSHYKTFTNMIIMFAPIIDVLNVIASCGNHSPDRVSAQGALDALQTFEFAFLLHLMKLVLGITNALSQALQRRDQDIVNVISLLATAKRQLQMTRDEGWDALLNTISSFCVKHDIEIHNMDDFHIVRGKSKRRRVFKITNEHYYRIDVFYTILDIQMQELNSLFSDTTLLLGVASLNPTDSFSDFDKNKILRMARLYPDDFDYLAIEELACELDTFIVNVRDDVRLSNMTGLAEFSRKLVQTKKHLSFPHLHLLLKLALILPVSTANVETIFSPMKFIKTKLRSRLSMNF